VARAAAQLHRAPRRPGCGPAHRVRSRLKRPKEFSARSTVSSQEKTA
jgi:hypothetical protein